MIWGVGPPGEEFGIQLESFNRDHLEGAARLLTRRHQEERLRHPQLPALHADPSLTSDLLTTVAESPHSMGVAVLRGEELMGFLLGEPIVTSPDSAIAPYYRPRSVLVRYHAHAVAAGLEDLLYRQLYAAAAQEWVKQGFFAHYVQVPASNDAMCQTFNALGFGQDLGWAIRDTKSLSQRHGSSQISIRQATPDDIEPIFRLNSVLEQFESRAPVFMPRQTHIAEAEVRADLANSLEDPNVWHWIAGDGDAIVGWMVFAPPPAHVSPLLTPDRTLNISAASILPTERGQGVGSALLSHGIDVARASGFDWCRLSWMTANPSSSRFWARYGFTPLAWRLVRVVDDRVVGSESG